MAVQEAIKEAFESAAALFMCPAFELAGQTLEQVFNDCESYGEATIYWGSWSDADLATVCQAEWYPDEN